MAISKFHILLLLFALIFTQNRADDAGDGSAVGSDDSDPFQIELDKLASKIQSLESLVHKKTEELRIKDRIIARKDRAIAEKDKMIKEELESMASLQNEAQGSLDANEQVQKAHTRSQELEKQVEKLQLELEQNALFREVLETRSKELENNLLEMNPKLQNLEQTIEEQKTKLHKTERALKLVEEELLKTKNEATQKVEELTEVHSAWLPSWLVAHMSSSQSYVDARWKEHGKPVLDTFTKKALEKKAHAEIWTESHIDTVKTKWIPAAKERWVIVISFIKPHVQLLTKKTKDVYAQSKKAVSPHVIKIRKAVDPHLQVAKKFCEPYVDQVAVAAKPHLDKARKTMKPYTNVAVQVYSKFLESATKYHHRFQGTVEGSLKKPETTRSLATKKFLWFIASVLLALPIVILFKTLSAIFFGAAKKPTKTNKTNHIRRKAKRAHLNK